MQCVDNVHIHRAQQHVCCSEGDQSQQSRLSGRRKLIGCVERVNVRQTGGERRSLLKVSRVYCAVSESYLAALKTEDLNLRIICSL